MNQLRKYTADYIKNLHSNLVIRNSCLHFEWRLYYCDNRVRHEVSNSVIRYPISRVSWRHRNQGEKMNTRQSSSSHRRGSLKRPHQRNSRALNFLSLHRHLASTEIGLSSPALKMWNRRTMRYAGWDRKRKGRTHIIHMKRRTGPSEWTTKNAYFTLLFFKILKF